MEVLLAHPDPELRAHVRASLPRADVIEAADATEALVACAEHHPEVALVALSLCGPEGGALLETIKHDPDLFRTAVVVLAGAHEEAAALKALERGAEDVLRDPPTPAEVVARVKAAERTAALRGQLLERERGLEELAYSDELTQLYNRRFLARQLAASIRSATRHERAVSVVLVDIDRFKAVNDEHGHEKGDIVLARVATRLGHVLRAEDFAGRWGGEEFLVLLPDVDEAGAEATAERLRESVGSRPVAGLCVTVSAGCATWRPGESPDDILRRADGALYAAKRAGRDSVQAAS
jgi:two-component system cell cycle response regulator